MPDEASVSLRRTVGALAGAAGLVPLVLSPALAQHAKAPDETPAGRILYHEESGGMVKPVAPPIRPAPPLPPEAVKEKARAERPAKATAAPPAAVMPPGQPQRPATDVAAKPQRPATDVAAKPRPGREAPARSVAQPKPDAPPALAPAAPVPPPGTTPAIAERLRYAATLQRHAASEAPAPERARALADEAGALMVQFRDAEAATALGWLWLEAQDPASAALWFARARTWAPDKKDTVRGLAFAAMAERDYERALMLADEMPEGEDRASIRRDARVALAERHYRSERYVDAARAFDEAAAQGELPRYARALHAWSLLNQGLRREAGLRFAGLYREQPDLETAQGLLAASTVAPLDGDLAATEPLAGLLRQRDAQAAFSQRRFLEARFLDEATFGRIGAVTAPHATVALAGRDKSGSEGGSRLRLRSSTTLAAYTPLDEEPASALRARFERQTLDAGSDATRTTVRAGEVGLRIERGFALDATLGRAGFGGPVGARTSATLDVAATPAWGQASLAATSLPVRESVLAYAGVRDADGTVRGRVFRHAIEARVLWLEAAPWSLAGRAAFARFTGHAVEGNTYKGAEAAVGHDLGLEGFSYAAVSLAASEERFQRNLSGFGPGHGGYFSPQRYRRAGAAFDFMTAERASWMVRGRAAAGHVWKREDAAASDGQDATLQLAAAVALTPYVHAGFAVAHGRSPQYRETQALVQVSVLAEPRATVASADLPAFPR